MPADHKWFARICAAAVLAHTLIGIDPQYPTVSADVRRGLAAVGRELQAEAPPGSAPDPYAATHKGSHKGSHNGHHNGHHKGHAHGHPNGKPQRKKGSKVGG